VSGQGGPIAAFDLQGPLPTGLTVLEASAGTGKTFTIAGLATRYVAEGLPIDALLIVTFTRAASGELRERVRQQLVRAERQLQRVLAGAGPDWDPLVAVLSQGTAAEVEQRRRRLDVAIAEFDAATIATTHGFCQHMLASLGTAGDTERASTFSEDADDLIDEVVDDLYVRKYVRTGRAPFTRKEARRFVGKAVLNPGADIDHANAPEGHAADMRERMAGAARLEVERRKLERATLGFDDLLTRLQATLADKRRGPAAAERLRARYRVALVDEFQDTDPIQWEILRQTFVHPDCTLVLIGDPKQAIYSFRGADVWSYLKAASQADRRATLATNWRSDKCLLDGIDALLAGSALGHPDIAYRHVEAAPANHQPGLRGVLEPAALRVRVLHRHDGAVPLTDTGFARKPAARQLIARDVAAEAVELLSSNAELVRRRPDGTEEEVRPLRASDLAVLVFTNNEAAVVHDALERVGLPAVLNGAGSVFGTETARHWLRVLEALERPASAGRARAVALTPFLGWSAARLAASDEREQESLQAGLHAYAAVLSRFGVAALLEHLSATQDLPARLLAQPEGERQLTDLRHIAQLLHAEATAGRLGTPALSGWLRRRITEAGDGASAEERSRRLESDADAVQVLTVHRSKGLEWPVVYLPYLWGNGPDEREPIPVYHDPSSDRRTVDVRGRSSPHMKLYTEERRGEDLRLAYVALTRARNQVVVWWAGSSDSRTSPMARLLLGARTSGGVISDVARRLSDEAVAQRVTQLAVVAPGCVAVERITPRPGVRLASPAAEERDLAVRTFDRPIDTAWRRTSYSAITEAAHRSTMEANAAVVASEPESSVLGDEPLAVAVPYVVPGQVNGDLVTAHNAELQGAQLQDAGLLDVPSPLADVPGSALLGTLIHAVLERTDFASTDLEAELARHLVALLPRVAPALADEPLLLPTLIPALRGVIETPLGSDMDDIRLGDVARRDRLDELTFELPLAGAGAVALAGAAAGGGARVLAGAGTVTGELTVTALADRIASWLPTDDPLVDYPEHLARLDTGEGLRGYLTGSIDLVLRLRATAEPHGAARFVVVDYKSNRLAGRTEPLSAWHYRPAAMALAMHDAHYPLQALLYSVALHRYLRSRVQAYDPQVHLGGVLYLFLRGMAGSGTPRVGGQPCGVFSWKPPAGLIVELSDLVDRGASVGS
jgi:exodeoxyribonuclease V beta subunit